VLALRAADDVTGALEAIRELSRGAADAPAWFRADLTELERTLDELERAAPEKRAALTAAARHARASEDANDAGDRPAAVAELRAACELLTGHLGPRHRDTLWRRVDLAWGLGLLQDAAASRDAALAALADADAAGLGAHPLAASAHSALGFAQLKLGRPGDAREAFERARAVWADLDRGFPLFREQRPIAVTGLAMLENAVGAHAAADALFAEAVALTRADPGEESESWANLVNNVGTAFLQRGRPRLAEPFLRRALEAKLALHPPGHPVVLNSLQNLAALLLATGDFASAEELVQRALDGIESPRGVELQLVALLESLAHADVARGELERARGHAARAVAIGRAAFADQPLKLRASFELLIQIEITRGALAAADELLAELLELTGEPSAGTLAARSRLALLRGEPDAADGLAEDALALLADVSADPFAAALVAHHGSVALELGELERAEDLFEEAATIQDAARAHAGPGLARAAFGGTRQWTAVAAVRAALEDAEGAWEAQERGRGRVLLELLDLGADGPADASGAGGAVRATALEPFERERIAAALAADEALVGWVPGADDVGTRGVWAWSLRADGEPRWAFSAGDPGPAVHAFRDALADAALAAFPPAPDADDAQARALYDALLAPLEPGLEGVRGLIAVPSEPVLGLPLEALRDAAGRAVAERWTTSYAPSGSVLAWLRDPARRAGSERGAGGGAAARLDDGDADGVGEAARALAIGDPPFREEHRGPAARAGASAGRGTRAEAGALRTLPKERSVRPEALPRLAASRREAEAIAALYPGSTVLVGEAASEHALAALDLGAFDVLHFATHALVDDERPERSALVLSQVDLPDPLSAALTAGRIEDGLLTAGDVARGARLRAELVTLSACDTALGREVPGEGYLGLADAFLQAGARAVVASLWSVDDAATALFMERFYTAWRAGASRAQALRDARTALRAHAVDGAHPYAHPGTWAAFVLIGDGR
jgi:CHAT domain-containing protein/Tfp pilus assembly protein PilF